MYKDIFTKIVMIQAIINWGEKIYSFLDIKDTLNVSNIFRDIKIIVILISSEYMYSAFPYPKLCSSSGGLLAILFPIKVIMEEKISLAEFMASANMALLLEDMLARNLIINNNKFSTIPNMLAIFTILYLLFIITSFTYINI